jgi:hypothetical protein
MKLSELIQWLEDMADEIGENADEIDVEIMSQAHYPMCNQINGVIQQWELDQAHAEDDGEEYVRDEDNQIAAAKVWIGIEEVTIDGKQYLKSTDAWCWKR